MRRALQTAVVGGVVAGSMLATVLPAHAATLPSGTLAVAATGSDTTQNFMGDYLNGRTTSSVGSGAANNFTVQTYNIPAFPTGSGVTVDQDVNCPDLHTTAPGYTGTITWTSTGAQTPPVAASGSGAGRTLLLGQRSVGSTAQQVACVDIARSSSKGNNASNGPEAGLEYYGFALDAVSWATTSVKAPSILTRQNLNDIYKCVVTNWSQVGGVPGPIQRYLPQNGSGTLNTFLSEYLGVSAASALPEGQSANGCPDIKQVDKNGNPFEENQGQTIANADIDKAILPYSGGVWAFQKNNAVNPSLDRRNNVRIGGVQTAPTSGSPIVDNVERWNATNAVYELDYENTANPQGVVTDQNTILVNPSFSNVTGFPGVRFLFNVVDSQNSLSYLPALGLIGFDNTASPAFVSPLCTVGSGGQRSLILSYGFAPLTNTSSSSNLAGTACRKF